MNELKAQIEKELSRYDVTVTDRALSVLAHLVECKTIYRVYEIVSVEEDGRIKRSPMYARLYEAEWDYEDILSDGRGAALLEEDVNGNFLRIVKSTIPATMIF